MLGSCRPPSARIIGKRDLQKPPLRRSFMASLAEPGPHFTALLPEGWLRAAQAPPGGLQKPTRGKEGSHPGRSPEGFHHSTGCPPGPMQDSSPVGNRETGLWPGGPRGMAWLGKGSLSANISPQPRVSFSAGLPAQCYSRFFLRPGNPEPPKQSLHPAQYFPRCDSGLDSSKDFAEPSSPGGGARQVEEGKLVPASPSASWTLQRWPKHMGLGPPHGLSRREENVVGQGTLGPLNATQRAIIRPSHPGLDVFRPGRSMSSSFPGEHGTPQCVGAGPGKRPVLTDSGASGKGSGTMRHTCDILQCSKPASQLPGHDCISAQN